MWAPLPTILLILTAISLGAACFMVMVAARSQREAVSAIFPIVREEESLRARRARRSIFIWIAATATFFGGWLATLTPSNQNPPTVAQSDSGSPVLEAGQSLEAAAGSAASLETTLPVISSLAVKEFDYSRSVDPASEAIVLNAPAAAEVKLVTPVQAPTHTPAPLTSAAAYMPGPRQPAPAGARIGPIEFATEITDSLGPVKASTTFDKNVRRVYAVFPFSGMSNGLDFTIVWYHNGKELLRDESPWAWGQKAKSYTFLRPRGEGLYKLELYINDSVAATSLFELR